MITVWELEKKEVISVSFEKWKHNSKLSWIDCDNCSKKDLEKVAEKIAISPQVLINATEENKRPRVIFYKDFFLIRIRGASKENEETKTAPLVILLFKKYLVTLHSKQIQGIKELQELSPSERLFIFEQGAPHLLFRLIDTVFKDFSNLTQEIGEKIDSVEDEVLQEYSKSIPKTVFSLKKTLIYLQKTFLANRDAIANLEREALKNFSQKDHLHFQELYNDGNQLLELLETYQEVLASVLDMYLSSVNNNLNKIMKTLTVISAFVLVPTLIAGIYGMNFQQMSPWNMPELYWKYGYFFALGLMITSVIIIFLIFKKKKWL